MTQNTTKNDKREQCDTKHNALKIYLTRKIYSLSYPVPPAHAPASVNGDECIWFHSVFSRALLFFPIWYFTSSHNSLTAMGAHGRPLLLFNELQGSVVSRRVFIHSQSLIARWTRNDLILAAVARDLYEACRINDVSRGSKSYLFWAS